MFYIYNGVLRIVWSKYVNNTRISISDSRSRLAQETYQFKPRQLPKSLNKDEINDKYKEYLNYIFNHKIVSILYLLEEKLVNQKCDTAKYFLVLIFNKLPAVVKSQRLKRQQQAVNFCRHCNSCSGELYGKVDYDD